MNQGGDRGKAPNKLGTEPKHRTEQTFQQPRKPGQGRAGRIIRCLPHEDLG